MTAPIDRTRQRFRLDEGTAILARTPAVLDALLLGLPDSWVAHDLDHVMQVSRTLGRQYSDAVGPWRANLRIISGMQG